MITKCCFCFNLKYGVLTYGVLVLAGRVTLTVLMHWLLCLIDSKILLENQFLLLSLTLGLGWLSASSFCLFLALKGIIKRRSILIYPFIVIMLFELACNVVWNTVLTFVLSPIYLINVVVNVVLNGYAALCLISLYKRYRLEEISEAGECLVKKV